MSTFGSWLDEQTSRTDDAGWIARAWHASGPAGADGRRGTRPRRYGVKSVEDWVRETLAATLDQGAPGRTDAALAVLRQAYEAGRSGGRELTVAQAASDLPLPPDEGVMAGSPGADQPALGESQSAFDAALAAGDEHLPLPPDPPEDEQRDRPDPYRLTGNSSEDLERIARAVAAEQGIDYDAAIARIKAAEMPDSADFRRIRRFTGAAPFNDWRRNESFVFAF